MNTKRIFCVMVTLLSVQSVFSQAIKEFSLKGHLSGTPVDSAVLMYGDAAGKYKKIASLVLNGEFTFRDSINYPTDAYILFKQRGEVISDHQYWDRVHEIYLEPGLLTLSGDPSKLAELKITGSKNQLDLDELEAKTAPVRLEMKPLEDAFLKEKDHEKAAAIHDQFDPYNDRIKKISYQFFLDHPNSYVTLDQMRFYTAQLTIDEVKRVYGNLNTELKASRQGKDLLAKIKKIERGLPGSMAANFATKDMNGNPLSLSGFKGKYVLLDFWASWCVPCRKGNPHMIGIYNKYKDKGFDMIGIAADDDHPANMKTAVIQDKIGIWHHVLDGMDRKLIGKESSEPNGIGDQYGISYLPTKILIDPAGKIIGRYGDSFGGSDEDLDKMLASLFNK